MSVNEDWLGEETSTHSSSSRIGIGISLLVFAVIGIVIVVIAGRRQPTPRTFTEVLYTDPPSHVSVYKKIQTSTFVESDIKRLEAFLKDSEDPTNFSRNRWSGEDAKEQLSQDLKDHFGGDKKNPAIFYVSFNVWGGSSSEDGKSPVIKLDADTPIELKILLQKIQEVPAKTKLVLLDAGQQSHDPDSGKPNEFIDQLDKLLQDKDEFGEDLWVIVSHAKSQTSFVAEEYDGSVFNWSIAAALTHLKRQPNNQDISVAQLYESICGVCSDYTTVDDGNLPRPLQTPVLMRGGTGIILKRNFDGSDALRVELANAIVVHNGRLNDLDLFPRDKEQSADDAGAGENGSTVDGGKAKKGSENNNIENARRNSTMAKLWRLRDELESREAKDFPGFSPVDIAPHFWILFNHELVDLDQRFVSQGASREEEAEASTIEEGLERLKNIAQTGRDKDDAPDSTETLKKIIEATKEFKKERNGETVIDNDNDFPDDLKKNLRDFRDAYYRSILYLDWCRHQVQSGSADGLQQVQDLCQRLVPVDMNARQIDFKQDDLREWKEHADNIREAEKKILNVWEELIDDPDVTVFRRKLLLKNFLSSPLISYRVSDSPAEETGSTDRKSDPLQKFDRAELRKELQKLTDRPPHDAFKLDAKFWATEKSTISTSNRIPELLKWRRSLTNSESSTEEGFRHWRDFVEFTPSRLADKSPEHLEFAMPKLNFKTAKTPFQIDFGKNLEFQKIDLDAPASDRRFEISFDTSGPPIEVQLVVEAGENDEELAELLAIEGFIGEKNSPVTVTMGQAFPIQPQNGKFPKLHLRFDAKPDQVNREKNGRDEIRLNLRLAVPARPDEVPIVLKLPRPVKTGISVIAKGLDEERNQLTANQIAVLQPYFNRYRPFEFRLKNDSGRPKLYNLELFNIKSAPNERLPGKLKRSGFLDKETIRKDLNELATTAKTPFAVAKDVRVSDKEKVVVWEVPEKAQSGNPETENPGASQPPADADQMDLTGGLLCRVKQQDDPEAGYTGGPSTTDYWIEFNELKLGSLIKLATNRDGKPLPPRIGEAGDFIVELQPEPDLPRAPFDEEEGVKVDLETDHRAQKSEPVTWTNQDKDAVSKKASIDIPPNTDLQNHTFVYLNVDDYRGAMIFKGPRFSQNQRPRDNFIRLRDIVQQTKDDSQSPGIRYDNEGNSWVLPTKEVEPGANSLKYGFKFLIDVKDGFSPEHYYIRFKLIKPGIADIRLGENPLLLDRKITYVAEIGKEGLLQVRENVSEHEIEWSPTSTLSGQYDIIAEIVDQSLDLINGDSQTQFKFPIHFDGVPPKVITKDHTPKTLYDDESFSITVEANDASGIAKAELIIDANNNGRKDQEEEKALEEKDVGSEPGQDKTIQFSISDLKKFGLTPEQETLNNKKYTLGVMLTDRFGSSSYAGPFNVTVKSRKKEDEEKKKAMEQMIADKIHTLEIDAIYRLNEIEKRKPPVQLSLKLDPEGKAITYRAGEKIILKLKPGKYDLKYDGLVKSTLDTVKVKGSFPFEVPRDSTGTIKLDMELKRDEEDKSP